MKLGGWKFPDSLDVEGDFKIALDLDAIHEQMHQLAEEATRHAVIVWLRRHGYTVVPPSNEASPSWPRIKLGPMSHDAADVVQSQLRAAGVAHARTPVPPGFAEIELWA